MVDTDPQAQECIAPEHIHDIAQPIVVRVATALLEAHGPREQVALIVGDQDFLWRALRNRLPTGPPLGRCGSCRSRVSVADIPRHRW
jgi:hypothetical protein